jgi:NADH-quinone oxidoreductase subunit G
MPRPEQRMITLTIDGREVRAPEDSMLLDAVKYGDIEIPYFCYEPKLGAPVGACRMCLIELEGAPKLAVACATAVKDGMVVHTQTAKVREAQEAVVEFLLINHPLDCPVCDKGGECPLQDITFGWGAGTSRFIEPKRHFVKPVELSPLIAIDRERCIICYRCVRFSQEVAEDYQLVMEERGAETFVGTFNGHPYVAPFSGNIIELCPVGALTSRAYRFRARPWEIEGAGTICTMCPAQCNVELTVRDERVLRVLGRDHGEVDDGWLCDKGRFAYQSIHVEERIARPMVRDGGELRPAEWDEALDAAAAALGEAGPATAALAGGEATNEEGFLLSRLLREGLGSAHLDSRAGAPLPIELRQALAAPPLAASVPDLEFAHAVLLLDCEPVDDAPILDLRLRKGMLRQGMRLAVATSRPSTLDEGAEQSLRVAPGQGGALLAALGAALDRSDDLDGLAGAAGVAADAVRSLATLLSEAGEDVVVLWGERLTSGPDGAYAAQALLTLAHRLGLREPAGAGLLEVPAGTNGRGLAEVGVLPNAGPGLQAPGTPGRSSAQIAAALADGELSALYLLHADPLRTHPDRARWERALERANAVIAHESELTETVRRYATVVFPAESYAEKEGTITHPDGRVQRLRPAIGHPVGVRSEWRVLADVAERVGLGLGVLTAPMATAQVVEAVPFYDGLTLEAIGGRGVRWPERTAAAAVPEGDPGPFDLDSAPRVVAASNGALRLGTFRSIWAAKEVESSPSLKFLAARQRAELSPADAQRLGIENGEAVEVVPAPPATGDGEPVEGARVRATAAVRANVPAGTVFLEEATASDPANVLTNGEPRLVEVRRP